MRYVNLNTDRTIELGKLAGEEKAFYLRALRRFQANEDWLSFDDVFDPGSPIYSKRRSHLDVLKDALYLALKDMWLQLGVQQGMIVRQEQPVRVPRHRRSAPAPRNATKRLQRVAGR